MAGGESIYPTTGVWWDLNTCPVPTDIDPGSVRGCIESMLRRRLDKSRPVTILAVGNLEYVSPELLKAISSSGIILRHTPFRGMGLHSLLYQWIVVNPPPAEILLISGDCSWYDTTVFEYGYNVLVAYPDWPVITDLEFWRRRILMMRWEYVLRENLGGVERSMLKVFKDVPAWFCQLCYIPSQSCDDFIKHLKSSKHREKLFVSVRADANGKPVLLCQVCQYPGYDDHNLNIHFNSDEHKQNASRASHNKPDAAVVPQNEEEKIRKKRNIKETNKALVGGMHLRRMEPRRTRLCLS